MKNDNLIPIERREGVTLYGRVVGKNGKLGQFEVHSEYLGTNNIVYHQYADAEKRFAAMIGIQKS